LPRNWAPALDAVVAVADCGDGIWVNVSWKGGGMRRALGALTVVVLLLSGCSSDPYPLPAGPPHAGQRGPARVGQPVTAVLIYLEVRPGDRIELLGAKPVGSIDGATVRFLLSRPVVHANGDKVIGEVFEPFEGGVATAAAASPGAASPGSDRYLNTVGIVAELTAQRAGRFEVTSVRLGYRLNGGSERVGEGIDVVWTVCADDPAPSACPA
jgi:hypothetical protein